uniref:Uncharacterized protein n=1 Tax=Knipowitschia caucasica TaxID=637954 RepID=A0AAV2JWW6_KNICA
MNLRMQGGLGCSSQSGERRKPSHSNMIPWLALAQTSTDPVIISLKTQRRTSGKDSHKRTMSAPQYIPPEP